jgi:protein required for attachment to host cells
MEDVRARVAGYDALPTDVKMGITGPTLFPSILQDNLVPPMLHGQTGFTNAVVTIYANWIYNKVQKVGDGEKMTRLAALGAAAYLQLKIKKRNDMMNELSAVLKQYKIEIKLHNNKSREAYVYLKKMKDDEARSYKDGEIEHHRLQEILSEEEINAI